MLSPARLVNVVARAPEVIAAGRQAHGAADLLRRYLRLGHGGYPVTVRLRNGARVVLGSPAEVQVFWQIFVRGCYTLPRNCRTIVDCGANVGLFSLWAALQRPEARIVALEPFAETFAALRRHIHDNELDGRVTCAQIGLAASSGQRRMETGAESPIRRMLPQDVDPQAATTAIDCITLAECLERFELTSVDVLKMDIEGSEWEVLLSTPPAVLRRIRHIELEYHEVHARFGYTPERLFAHLAAGGHRLVSRTEDAFRTGLASFELAA